MSTVVLASSNAGKLRELAALLEPLGWHLELQDALGIEPAAEPYGTFVENALAKARHASAASRLPAIADDSGLCVAALDGAPGIRSARYAGPHGDDEANIERLLRELDGIGDRTAHFYCCIVLLAHEADPAPIIALGTWHGQILAARQGAGGFGYDPVFYLPALGCTAAELDATEKARLSHRGQAIQALRQALGERRVDPG